MLGDIITVRWPDADGVWKNEVEKRLAAVSQQLEVRKDGQSADGLSAADPVTLTIIAAAIPATAIPRARHTLSHPRSAARVGRLS